MSATEVIVVLLLHWLPLTATSGEIDRSAIAARAGCLPGTAHINVSENSNREWTAVVRCRAETVPTAEVLRDRGR